MITGGFNRTAHGFGIAFGTPQIGHWWFGVGWFYKPVWQLKRVRGYFKVRAAWLCLYGSKYYSYQRKQR